MPPSPQDGHKRPYNAKQGLSRPRGRMGMVTSKALLSFSDTSAFRIQLQLVELPLVELIHCCLRWQNSVEVVALPLHPALIEVSAMLHCDEPSIQEDSDTFHCGVPGHADLSGDGIVAGMAGVRPAILYQQEIGVDHKRRGRKVQQKNFVRQSEKLSVISVLESGSERPPIRDEFPTYQTGQILFHRAHCHVDVPR